MIQIVGSRLCQWDVGRSVSVSDSKATHVHLANQGDSKAPIIEIKNGEAKIPDYLLQTGKTLHAYAVLDGVTLESKSFAVCKRERPENYVYEDDQRNYIYDLITNAEDAAKNANLAAQKANEAAEKIGSVVIPTKVSQLQNDSGFLTEVPVTTTKVSLTEQPDGSYLSSLTAAEIMADYKANKTVHCYHDKMILPLIHSVITTAVFSGIYDGQIQIVTVDSNKVATVTATPISSGGGSVDLTGYATEEYVNKAIEDIELTPGPAGPQGEVGPQGPQGPQGEQGDDYQLTEADKKEIAAMAGPPEWQKIDVKLEENVYYFTISIPNAKEVYIVGEMYGNDVEGTLGDIGKVGGYDLFINERRHYGGLLGQVGVCFPMYEVWEISSVGTRLIISRCGGTDGHMYQLQRSTDILAYEFGPIHTLQLYSYSEYYFDKRTKLEVWYR